MWLCPALMSSPSPCQQLGGKPLLLLLPLWFSRTDALNTTAAAAANANANAVAGHRVT